MESGALAEGEQTESIEVHAASPGDTISIFTQNAWCHYPMSFAPWAQCGHALPGSDTTTRLQLLAAHIAEKAYDIVCIQELFLWKACWVLHEANFKMFAQLLREAGLVHHTNPQESLSGWGQNSGVAIFSRFPFVATKSVNFTHTAESLNNKGFVTADMKLPNGKAVRVISTHLDARDWSAKQEQIEQLAVAAADQGDAGLFVCGDFNVCPQTEENGGYDDGSQYTCLVEQMESRNLKDAWRPSEAEPTHGLATLDHIFWQEVGSYDLDSKSVVRVVDPKSGLSVSDHYGLEAHFSLR